MPEKSIMPALKIFDLKRCPSGRF